MIIRTEKTNNFTSVDNRLITDVNLKAKEKGLLICMLSKPDNWKFSIRSLAKESAEGESAVQSALKVLEKNGYVIRKPIRDENGRFEPSRFIVLESPELKPKAEQCDKPKQRVFRIEKKKYFTQIDNQLLADPDLSYKAKGVMALMLSKPNSWRFAIADLCREMKDGKQVIASAINELTEAGYIEKERLRDLNGRFSGFQYTIIEAPKTAEKGTQRTTAQTFPFEKFRKKAAPQNQFKAKAVREDHSEAAVTAIPLHKESKVDIEALKAVFRDHLEYDLLTVDHGRDKVDQIINIMVEPFVMDANVVVRGSKVPNELVKKRFMELRAEHIAYVFECLKENTSHIRNMRAYLLTTLYNAPLTMDTYYANRTAEMMASWCG